MKNALVIPQKATFEVQDKLFVLVVDSDNVVHLRNFVPQLRLPHLYIVASGLAASDLILYEGIQNVTDGKKIDPQPVSFHQHIAQLAQQ